MFGGDIKTEEKIEKKKKVKGGEEAERPIDDVPTSRRFSAILATSSSRRIFRSRLRVEGG